MNRFDKLLLGWWSCNIYCFLLYSRHHDKSSIFTAV